MSTSIPPINKSSRVTNDESRTISFSGLLWMSSSSNVRNPRCTLSLSESSVRSDSLLGRIVGLDGVRFESFMALTLSATEALVIRCVLISKEAERCVVTGENVVGSGLLARLARSVI